MRENFEETGFARRLSQKLIAAMLVTLTLGADLANSPSAFAQADPFAWFEQLFRPPPSSRIAKPRPEYRRSAPPRHIARSRPSYPAAERSRRHPEQAGNKSFAKPTDKPAGEPTFVVAVLGDSLGQMLAQGLSEAFENRPDVAILRKAKENSGLVRDDFYDWTKATQDMLTSGEKIDFAVMLIGSNDRQSLHTANGSYEPGSPEWQAAYTQRIETIAGLFRDKKIPLIWVGLPILKSETLSADAVTFNQFYRAYAEKTGAIYIDVWEAFADDAGQYSVTGPDINGQTVKLRAADGVHFTKAGARKLAHFVEPDIRRKLDELQPKIESGIPSPAQNPESVPSDGGGTPPTISALPEGKTPTPPKPVAGPILPLTAPALTPGGELASRMTAADVKKNDARKLIEQTLQQGSPIPAKPGRADDFSWPRP